MPTEQEIREKINDLSEKWYDIITELCAKAYVTGLTKGYNDGISEGERLGKNGQEDNDQKGMDRIAEKPQSD